MHLTRQLLAAGSFAVLTLAASPASADAITFDSSNVGTAYTLNYDGFSDGTTINGLTGQTTFTLTGISGNSYTFDYSVTNTTSAPVTGSRISGFAFDTNPDINSATSTGAFAYTTLGSTYPNGIGSVDVCFKDASTGACAGGGSGGLTLGETGTGTFTLNFSQPVSSLTLDDFYVRYQSITGAGNVTSASGSGTLTSTTSGGTVPEPGMLGLMAGGLAAIALLRRRRQPTRVQVRAAYG